jgi:hypothetical protein
MSSLCWYSQRLTARTANLNAQYVSGEGFRRPQPHQFRSLVDELWKLAEVLNDLVKLAKAESFFFRAQLVRVDLASDRRDGLATHADLSGKASAEVFFSREWNFRYGFEDRTFT